MADTSNDEEARSNPSTIEGAVTIYEKMFNVPQVRDTIEKLDNLYGRDSPCNSISKLLEINYRCKSTGKMAGGSSVFTTTWHPRILSPTS